MKKFILSLVTGLLFFAACSSDAKTSDSTVASSEATISEKIVSTTVAGTQIFDKLAVDLVGVPDTASELPSRYAEVTKVGYPMNPDLEIIATLTPDVVYGTKTLQTEQQENFKNANISAEFLDFTSIGSMQEEITKLGDRYDRESEAKKLVKAIQEKIDAVQEKVAKEEPVKVLILMGVPGSYLVCTENSFLGDLVRLAGGTNVISGESAEYLASNTEYMQSMNPDVILRAAHGMPEEVVEMFNKDFQTNDIWQHFDAVKNNRVYDLDYELFGMTATLESTTALEELANILYGGE